MEQVTQTRTAARRIPFSKVCCEGNELAYLKEGLPVRATTKAFPNRVFPGTIAFVHPHLDAATRTLRVRFSVKNPRHELRPGMYADLLIVDGDPLEDVRVLEDRARLRLIMKDGEQIKNTL